MDKLISNLILIFLKLNSRRQIVVIIDKDEIILSLAHSNINRIEIFVTAKNNFPFLILTNETSYSNLENNDVYLKLIKKNELKNQLTDILEKEILS